MRKVVYFILICTAIFSCKKGTLDELFNPGLVEDLTVPGNPNVSFQNCYLTSAFIDTNVFGMHIHGETHTHPNVLAAIDDINLSWVLNGVHWPTIEPDKDNYNLEAYDDFMVQMANRNENLILSIGNYWPLWIEDSEQLKIEIAEMTKRVVKRYKPNGEFSQENGFGNYGCSYWELINEPNLPCCGWGYHGANQPVNSALYAEIVSVMHEAIRQEDPNAKIVLGGLSSSNEHQGPIAFLDDLYSYGAINAFDIIAYHPYGEHNDLSIPLAAIEAKMQEYGDQKPIWITEIGEPNLNDNDPVKDSQVEVFNAIVAQDDLVPAIFWLGLVDLPINQTWGILDGNLTPRQPIYDSVQVYLN